MSTLDFQEILRQMYQITGLTDLVAASPAALVYAPFPICGNSGAWTRREDCDCDECHDYRQTLAEKAEEDAVVDEPTQKTFRAAEAAPELCKLEYYGIECNCPRDHEAYKRDRR